MEELYTKYSQKLKEFAHRNDDLTLTMAFVGAVLVSVGIIKPIYSMYKYLLRPSKNLRVRYGSGWALVTGASDGIGKAYAFELARRGFKVALHGRNSKKLEKVAEEIAAKHKVATTTVVFDFNTHLTDEKLAELKAKIEKLGDISVLINNIGAGKVK